MSNAENILVIVGHPSTRSLSHKLAAEYALAAKQAGKKVTVIDAYRTEPVLPLADYQDYTDWDKDKPARTHHQKLVTTADAIVFFHPLWWGGLPGGLKNYIDQVFTPGFAYKYKPHSWLPDALNIKPVGYFKGKRSHTFITYDAYTIIYILMLFPFVISWATQVLLFTGIWRMRFTLHQRVRWSSEAKRKRWVQRARRLGSRA